MGDSIFSQFLEKKARPPNRKNRGKNFVDFPIRGSLPRFHTFDQLL